MVQRHSLRKKEVKDLRKKIEELETKKEAIEEQRDKANFERDAKEAYIAKMLIKLETIN